ncbi:alpha/beta hydrolase family esterase [Nocardia crassostreae]|uniref:alpha/beta hydrolase family esterase n=1 Tax=Nocardia crassostreae TaxID=53428 RepID=UPI0009FED0CF|nr:PHB depolymerase family esterase [Nocardia crassostreae]
MFGFRTIAVAAIALSALALTACDSSSPSTDATASTTAATQPETPGPGDHTVRFEFGGKTRSYVVHAPPGYTAATALPLVIALHPRPGDAAEITELSALNAKADTENFLVAYPEGASGAFNALICCGSEDDVGFIKAVITRLTTTWKADPTRVYATGISNGGDMSFRLAVELPGTFAAIAPVSGGFIGTPTDAPTYKPTTPVPVLTFLGGRDRYADRFEAGITRWQERLGCTPAPALTNFPRSITLTTATCADGSEVQVYRLPEMFHSWPGATQGSLPDATAGISATDLIWDFFKSHP